MNEQGKVIIESVRQVKDIYEQIAHLLQEADAMMKAAGWVIYGSTASYGSGSIYYPREWVPSRPLRFYSHKDKPDQHKILAAVVYDDDEPDRFHEPLLIATTLLATEREGPKPSAEPSDATSWYLSHSSRGVDGEIEKIVLNEIGTKDKRDMRSVEVLAVPLVGISDSADLKYRVIDPFLGRRAEKVGMEKG